MNNFFKNISRNIRYVSTRDGIHYTPILLVSIFFAIVISLFFITTSFGIGIIENINEETSNAKNSIISLVNKKNDEILNNLSEILEKEIMENLSPDFVKYRSSNLLTYNEIKNKLHKLTNELAVIKKSTSEELRTLILINKIFVMVIAILSLGFILYINNYIVYYLRDIKAAVLVTLKNNENEKKQ